MDRKGFVALIGALILVLVALLGLIIGLALFKIKLDTNIVYEYKTSTITPILDMTFSTTKSQHPGYEIIGEYFGISDTSTNLRKFAPPYVTTFPTDINNNYKKIFSNTWQDNCYALIKLNKNYNKIDSALESNCPDPIDGHGADVSFAPIALAYNPNENTGLVIWLVGKKV